MPTPTLFDPVAVTYAIRPELCPVKPMRIEVDDKGFTRPVDGAPNAQVCLQSDEKGFLELLLNRIVGASGTLMDRAGCLRAGGFRPRLGGRIRRFRSGKTIEV